MTSSDIEERRRIIERRIGLDYFPIQPLVQPPSMRKVEVPLAVLYWLARGTQSYLGVHYVPLALGFPPPQTKEKKPPDLSVLTRAIAWIEEGLTAELTLDSITPPE